MSCEPKLFISLTLHSKFIGHSAIDGANTFLDCILLNLHSANLSISFPDFVPQKSTSYTKLSDGIFITNSFLLFIIS